MCGIAGIINGGNAELLGRMSDIIVHRGPDDAGLEWFADSSSGLAFRRLSIIDLTAAGHQPMSAETGDLWIVFNGEIYNYKELGEELAAKGVRFRSHSDTGNSAVRVSNLGRSLPRQAERHVCFRDL